MGTTLTGTTPQDTYDSLIKVTDNGPLSGTLKALSDGLGNDSTLSLSTTAASIAGTLAVTGNATFDTNTLFVDAANNRVGVGTASPSSRFHISAASPVFQISDTNKITNNSLHISAVSQTAWGIGTDASGTFTGTKLTITDAGNVGIGTSAPASMLTLNGLTPYIRIERSGVPTWQIQNNTLTIDAGFSINNLTNAGTPFFINGTTNNVGIGTSAPEAKLDIKDSSAGGSIGMFIENAAGSTLNNSADIYFGTWGGSTVAGVTNARISAVNVNAGNAESNIDFYTYNGATSGKRVSITSNGLTFNGDTAAANSLDDYEEGTWTPSITFGGASVGVTYSSAEGRYTKIGRQVSVTCYILLTNKGSSTGSARIAGLPFSLASGVAFYPTGSLSAISAITYLGMLQAYLNVGLTTIDFVQTTELGVQAPTTDTNFTNGSQIIMSATYFV